MGGPKVTSQKFGQSTFGGWRSALSVPLDTTINRETIRPNKTETEHSSKIWHRASCFTLRAMVIWSREYLSYLIMDSWIFSHGDSGIYLCSSPVRIRHEGFSPITSNSVLGVPKLYLQLGKRFALPNCLWIPSSLTKNIPRFRMRTTILLNWRNEHRPACRI